MMKWKGYVRKRSWPNLRFYPGIFLKRLRKTKKSSLKEADLRTEI
jgi:hypothetical protein